VTSNEHSEKLVAVLTKQMVSLSPYPLTPHSSKNVIESVLIT